MYVTPTAPIVGCSADREVRVNAILWSHQCVYCVFCDAFDIDLFAVDQTSIVPWRFRD